MTTLTAKDGNGERANRRTWMGLAILALPTLLISMDTTVMYLALPTISAALKPGSTQLLWISDIYGFIEAGFLITMGTLGDKIGRRKFLLIGAVCFGAASAVAAFAETASQLIAARALLGVVGATLLPSTLSLIRNMFHDDKQRMLAIGLWTTCFSAGTMLGPFVGGILLEHFWWGSVFLMGVPVMLLFLILSPWLLPEFKDADAGRIDLSSVLLLLAGTLSMVYSIKQFAKEGPGYIPIGAALAGLAIVILFFKRQGGLKHPLINKDLFKIRAFNLSLSALTIALFSWAGMFLFVGQYLQLVFNMQPFQAGLWTVPSAIGSIATCMGASFLSKKFSQSSLIATGLALMSISLLLLVCVLPGLPAFILFTIVLSAGCGLTVTLSNNAVVSSAPPEKAGSAAGLSETCAALGASLGMALLGSISLSVYRDEMAGHLTGLPQQLKVTALETLGGASIAGEQLGSVPGEELLNAAKLAFSHSVDITAFIDAVLLIFLATLIYLKLKRVQANTPDLKT